MLSPTGKFGQTLYVARSIAVENLDGIIIDGPLYNISLAEIEVPNSDNKAHRQYVKKTAYKIRYGVTLI